ncbi:MAG: hypothetical protein AAB874_04470 [Patescibacteria group bacterium]
MAANAYERFMMPKQFTTTEEALNWGWGAAFCFIILDKSGRSLPGYEENKLQALNIQAFSRPQVGESNYEASLLISTAWVSEALSLLHGFKDKMGDEEAGLRVWTGVVLEAAGLRGEQTQTDMIQKAELMREFAGRTWSLRSGVDQITDDDRAQLAAYFLPVWHQEDSANFAQADHFAREVNGLIHYEH